MKLYLFSFFFLVQCYFLQGQISAYSIDRQGDTTQIILKKNKYITGVFNALAFQENPKYQVGTKFEKIDLKTIYELGFETEGESYIYRAIIMPGGIKLRRLEVDGGVEVYSEMSQHMTGNPAMGGGPITQVKYIIKQGAAIPFYVKGMRIKKQLRKELLPCEAFNNLLDTGTYGTRDIRFLIESYNQDCQ